MIIIIGRVYSTTKSGSSRPHTLVTCITITLTALYFYICTTGTVSKTHTIVCTTPHNISQLTNSAIMNTELANTLVVNA